MISPLARSLAFALVAVTTSVVAQEPAAPPPAVAPAPSPPAGDAAIARGPLELLDRAIRGLLTIDAVTCSSFQENDDAMSRQFRGMMPAGMGETELDVTRVGELRYVRLNNGDDELVANGDTMIARQHDGPWKLRHDCLTTGAALPFVFDPHRFATVFQSLPVDARPVAMAAPTSWRDRELTLVSMTIDGDAANDLVFGGAIAGSTGGGPRMMLLGGGGGAGGDAPAPKATVDLAFYIDPVEARIHRVVAQVDSENPLPGMVRMEVAGGFQAGGDDEPVAEVVEFDEQGERIYKRGLPVRKLGDSTNRTMLDVRMSGFGEAEIPELDAAARRALGLR